LDVIAHILAYAVYLPIQLKYIEILVKALEINS